MKRKVLNNTASNTFKVDFPEFVMLMTDGYKDNKEKKVNDEEAQKEKRLEEREEEICDLFNLFDRDGSGSISLEELAQVMIRFGGLNKEDIALLVIQADLDGDGMVIFVIFQKKPPYSIPKTISQTFCAAQSFVIFQVEFEEFYEMMRKPGEQPGRRKLNDIWNAMLAKNSTHQKNTMPDGK